MAACGVLPPGFCITDDIASVCQELDATFGVVLSMMVMVHSCPDGLWLLEGSHGGFRCAAVVACSLMPSSLAQWPAPGCWMLPAPLSAWRLVARAVLYNASCATDGATSVCRAWDDTLGVAYSTAVRRRSTAYL